MLNSDLLIKIIKEKLKNLANEIKEEGKYIINFKEIYDKIEIESLIDKFKENHEIFELIEKEKRISLNTKIVSLKEKNWIFEEMEKIRVISIDTSEIIHPHLFPYFVLINVGFFGCDYEKKKYYETSIPYFLSKYDLEQLIEGERTPSWYLNYLRLKYELETIENFSDKINLENSYIFFDESFSASYLYLWNKNSRKKVIEKIYDNIDVLTKYDAIPIAVFYSLTDSFVNFLEGKIQNKRNILKHKKISDKEFFNIVLSIGERSPLFRIHNIVTKETNLSILTFYLKISNKNVLRIEFPENLKDKINEIHKIVFLQSIIGEGYPYCMIRAHEQAYLTSKEKRFVIDLLAKYLHHEIKEEIVYLSKKEQRKIRGIV